MNPSFDDFTFDESESSSNYSEFDEISSEEEYLGEESGEKNKSEETPVIRRSFQNPRDPTISWSGKPLVKKTILTSEDFIPMAKDSTDTQNHNSAKQLMDTTTLDDGKKKNSINKKKQTKESSQKSKKIQNSTKSPDSKDKAGGKQDTKEEGRKTKKAAVITQGKIEEDRGAKIVKNPRSKKVSKPKNDKKKAKKHISQDLNEQLKNTFNELGSILFQTSFR